MTGWLRPWGLIAVLTCVGGAPPVFAHDAVKAIVLLKNGDPRLAAASAIAVSVLAPPGMPTARQVQRVTLSGAMTGHAMPPLDVELTRDGFAGEYAGRIAFTMAGPWRLTVRIDLPNEQMWGTLDVPVRAESAAFDPRPLRFVVEMQDPVRQTLFPPLRTAAAAIALTLLLEAIAVGLAWRRGRFLQSRSSRLKPVTAPVP